ncbi:MAG TPA: orotidine-5'-phosphate decarboxylase [Pyrinomonadaceae bacterium]|nr:orotidine-5'-phosphate decarboxylase [Pyrinomonadaceae bacterium]
MADLKNQESARKRLIVALDVASGKDVHRLVARLQGAVGMFKVGSQLFTAAGPVIIRELVRRGERVFLDLKFHDIPNTVAAAGVEAMRLGASIFNVHASGGREMMMRTGEAVGEAAAKEGLAKPAIIAVTVLTSADASTLSETGMADSPEASVRRLAVLTESAGLDGVVASPNEVATIRSAIASPDFLVVTPGVRLEGSAADDQRRISTPANAIAAGASYLVVGRPITAAADPRGAAEAIVAEMAAVQ